MQKKLNGKVKAGKPIVIPEDVAAAFDVPFRGLGGRIPWTPEQDTLMLTKVDGGFGVGKLTMNQFQRIFKNVYGFGSCHSLNARLSKLQSAGITAENYAERLAAGEIPV